MDKVKLFNDIKLTKEEKNRSNDYNYNMLVDFGNSTLFFNKYRAVWITETITKTEKDKINKNTIEIKYDAKIVNTLKDCFYKPDKTVYVKLSDFQEIENGILEINIEKFSISIFAYKNYIEPIKKYFSDAVTLQFYKETNGIVLNDNGNSYLFFPIRRN